MLTAVGIDLASIERVGSWLARFSARELAHVFDAAELDAARAKPDQGLTLAACFSAKESVSKALGTGFAGVEPSDVVVRVGPHGLAVALRGTAAEVAHRQGIRAWRGAWRRVGPLVLTSVAALGQGGAGGELAWSAAGGPTPLRLVTDPRRHAREAWRLMSPGERNVLRGRRDPGPGLAARLVARVAAARLLGDTAGAPLREIRVDAADTGAPLLSLSGRAAEAAARISPRGLRVSLTHEDPLAAAVVAAAPSGRACIVASRTLVNPASATKRKERQ